MQKNTGKVNAFSWQEGSSGMLIAVDFRCCAQGTSTISSLSPSTGGVFPDALRCLRKRCGHYDYFIEKGLQILPSQRVACLLYPGYISSDDRARARAKVPADEQIEDMVSSGKLAVAQTGNSRLCLPPGRLIKNPQKNSMFQKWRN